MQLVLRSNEEERYPTNETWRIFFLVTCIVWVICWIPVIVLENEYSGLPGNMTVHDVLHFRSILNYNESIMEWNNSVCSPYVVYSKIITGKNNSDKGLTEKRDKDMLVLITIIHFFFHVLTFDPTYFANCSDPWFPVNYFFTGVFGILFIFMAIYFISGDKKMLSKQPSVMVSVFLFIIIIEHLSQILISFISPTLWPYDERLINWLIPEAMTLAILQLNILFTIKRKIRENDEDQIQNDSSAVGSNNNDDEKDLTVYKTIPFYYYTYAMIFGFFFVVILKFLMISTMIAFNKIGWHNKYFLLILACSFYIGRTIYCLGLLLTSYATNKSIDSENFGFKNLKHAILVVSRYHFGTASLHGLIDTPCVDMELTEYGYSTRRADPKKMRKDFCKYYRLSSALTAAYGYDHADTVFIVSEFVLNTPMHEYFSSFGSTTFYMYFLLLPTNFFTHVYFWHYGFFDANLAEASWTMYLTIVLTFSSVMQFYKVVSDTVGLRMYEERTNRESNSYRPEEWVNTML